MSRVDKLNRVDKPNHEEIYGLSKAILELREEYFLVKAKQFLNQEYKDELRAMNHLSLIQETLLKDSPLRRVPIIHSCLQEMIERLSDLSDNILVRDCVTLKGDKSEG